jgi:hypothetical protein
MLFTDVKAIRFSRIKGKDSMKVEGRQLQKTGGRNWGQKEGNKGEYVQSSCMYENVIVKLITWYNYLH